MDLYELFWQLLGIVLCTFLCFRSVEMEVCGGSVDGPFWPRPPKEYTSPD